MEIYYTFDQFTGEILVGTDSATYGVIQENYEFFKKDTIEWLKVSLYAATPGHALLSWCNSYYENAFDHTSQCEVMDALDHMTSGTTMELLAKVQAAQSIDEFLEALGHIALAVDTLIAKWVD